MRMLMLASVASMIDQFNMPNIKMLLSIGYKVDVACNFVEGSTCSQGKIEQLKATLTELGVDYYQIDFSRDITKIIRLGTVYKQVKKLMKDNEYDFVHCHSPIGGLIARMAGKVTRTKVIYTAHGFHFYKGAPLKNWFIYYPVEWLFAHWTDTLITINQEDYVFAQRHMHAKRVVYVPGVGVDLGKYRQSAVEKLDRRAFVRQELGITVDDWVLVYVAELNQNKNQSSLLDMLYELLKNKQNVRLLLVGTGNAEKMLKEKSMNLSLYDHVIFAGYRSDIPAILAASDIAVPSSKREGLPLNVIEAMAAGLPVVAYDNRGHRSIISDGINGYLVAKGNDALMSERVLYLINNPDEYKRISEAGIDRSRSFGLESVLDTMKDIYCGSERLPLN